jgi:hypothetical protein
MGPKSPVACGALWSRSQHTVAFEEAQASFCPNLAAASRRIICKNPIPTNGLRWKIELFSADYSSVLRKSRPNFRLIPSTHHQIPPENEFLTGG